tara:strand:- start:1280 stop:1792 length:513 start_codon:yes stop_codon:yes gene_type:complete
MSLVQRSKTSKRFYKKLKNFSTASIEIGSSESSINEFNLILDGVFKMIVITYEGENKIIPTNYLNFKIIKNINTITIINYSKKALKNNLLFEYVGSMIIKNARIYKWGGRSQLVKFEVPLATINILKDSNLMSSDALVFKEEYNEEKLDRDEKINRNALLEKKLRRYNGI